MIMLAAASPISGLTGAAKASANATGSSTSTIRVVPGLVVLGFKRPVSNSQILLTHEYLLGHCKLVTQSVVTSLAKSVPFGNVWNLYVIWPGNASRLFGTHLFGHVFPDLQKLRQYPVFSVVKPGAKLYTLMNG